MRPKAQRRRMPPAIHTDAAHAVITTELVRLTLQNRGGARMGLALAIVAVFVLLAIGASCAAALCVLIPWR